MLVDNASVVLQSGGNCHAGKEVRLEMREKECICLLKIDPRETYTCNDYECPHCGWEEAEYYRRCDYMKKHGLTECEDGLRRLILNREDEE